MNLDLDSRTKKATRIPEQKVCGSRVSIPEVVVGRAPGLVEDLLRVHAALTVPSRQRVNIK